ncbi:MAG TPA: single-stranded DNA-binding protein [Mycobacteriales bacterium]|nr:single-stranded DNA-binding protein [Mycobacteriales bacterium]
MTAAGPAAKPAAQRRPTTDHRNEVNVTGRLSMAATERVLPSGDEIVSWRLVVDRSQAGPRPGIEVIDCSAFPARIRRAALRWQPGDIIAVEGSLRRRFWRSGTGTASRYEVEVTRAVRVG